MKPDRQQLQELLKVVAATAPEEIDCGELLDRVAAYLEAAPHGELPPELAQVAQHLAICPECLEEYEALVAAVGKRPDQR